MIFAITFLAAAALNQLFGRLWEAVLVAAAIGVLLLQFAGPGDCPAASPCGHGRAACTSAPPPGVAGHRAGPVAALAGAV